MHSMMRLTIVPNQVGTAGNAYYVRVPFGEYVCVCLLVNMCVCAFVEYVCVYLLVTYG